MGVCHLRELSINRGDVCFECADFLNDQRRRVSEQIREGDVGVLQDRGHARDHPAGTDWNRQTLLPQ